MLTKTFNNLWEQWLEHHAQSDKELLFVVLLNNMFDWDAVSEKLQYTPYNPKTLLRREAQKRLMNEDASSILPLYPILADNPYVHRVDTGLAEIYELENFITPVECDTFKELVCQNLSESKVTDPYADKRVRTSKTAILNADQHEIIRQLDARMHLFMRIPTHCSEAMQGHVYEVGQEFKPHFDFFDFTQEFNKPYKEKGQRLWTLMVYLDEPAAGGATQFKDLQLEFAPQKGKALIWRNCLPNGYGNTHTMHAGLPVLEGQKTILTKWFNEYKPK